jgi:hypothetical protein
MIDQFMVVRCCPVLKHIPYPFALTHSPNLALHAFWRPEVSFAAAARLALARTEDPVSPPPGGCEAFIFTLRCFCAGRSGTAGPGTCHMSHLPHRKSILW